MPIMQEKDIETLIKRRDKINTHIEIIEKQNNEIDIEIEKLLSELREEGVDVTLDTLSDVYTTYENKCETEYAKLKLSVEQAEEELRGVI